MEKKKISKQYLEQMGIQTAQDYKRFTGELNAFRKERGAEPIEFAPFENSGVSDSVADYIKTKYGTEIDRSEQPQEQASPVSLLSDGDIENYLKTKKY